MPRKNYKKKHRRGHHNNTSLRRIKNGQTREEVREIARKLSIPYGKTKLFTPR